MDALTDILRTVHLSGSVYFRSDISAPWGMEISAQDIAGFHVIRQGRCWLTMLDEGDNTPILLEAGDLIVLPHGHAHVLADDPQTKPEKLEHLISQHKPGEPFYVGGGGPIVTLICGYFDFATGHVHPLLSILPSLIVIRGEGGRAQQWLKSTLDLIAQESTQNRPGSEIIIDRLTETMFIQVLRSYLAENEEGNQDWLNGLKDEQIANALALIHRQPEEHWTVESLANKVAMSRSSFSARFKLLVGEPPLRYLTRWRMELAATHLREAKLSIIDISEKVGYQAESSFSKVFKKMWGIAPGAYRKNQNTLMV